MVFLWYCCQCNFGPHNPDLHDECIMCGAPSCAQCYREAISISPRSSPPKPEEAPTAIARNGKKKQKEDMKKAEVKNIESSSKSPDATKLSLEELDSRVDIRQHHVSPKKSYEYPRTIATSRRRSTSTIRPDQQKLGSTVSVTYSPSVGSAMIDWIYEQHSLKVYSSDDIQLLETILVELKSVQPETIFVDGEVRGSLANSFKGNVEALLGGSLDWWPFQSYIPPLAQDQVAMRWECPCGDTRSIAVPRSFALKITDVSTNQATKAEERPREAHGPAPGIGNPSTNSTTATRAQTRARAGQQAGQLGLESELSRSTANNRSLGNPSDQLHAFLILLNTSLMGSAHCLTQTDVRGMNDQTFFTWVRNSYYSRRGVLAIWFGLSSFSHCEFFRFRRFDGYEYAPLLAEYPNEDEPFYHFSPKPMRPRPPMSSHEFNHWFYKDSWSRIVRRWRLTPSQRSRAKGLWLTLGSRYVVEEKIPKRETALEEGVLEHEDFWGLYVVEKLSVFRLVIYSLAFLSPSVYFFFAWLFEWGHGGDLQNASVPIALSLAPLATFWGFVLSTSHGSGSPRVS